MPDAGSAAASLTGGCQCGELRFRSEGPFNGANICHCRMCQKAVGAPFAAFVPVPSIEWTRGGVPKYWASSEYAKRGFCGTCGTTLTYEPEGPMVGLALATFDDPDDVRLQPTVQFGSESKRSCVDGMSGLPLHGTEETVHTRQHPDRETEVWPEVDA